MLDWLVQAGYRNLIVCHLDHRLRGRSSDADARFVRQLVTNYQKRLVKAGDSIANLAVVVSRTNVRASALKKKMSIEAAAREARYEFFAKVAKEKKCHALVLAHHADDLVETFLINLFRGAGNAGLASIRESSRRSVAAIDLHILRPWLGTWRAEIDKYIRQNRLRFREDVSNKELGPLRNRIRHRVIPYLEKNLGRGVRQNIWRTAMIAGEEESLLNDLMPEVAADSTALALLPLREMPVALQRRALHKWLRGADVADIGFDLIERVRGLLDVRAGPARTNLPRNRHVRRRAGKLIME